MLSVIASKVGGLRRAQVGLDGKWRINPSPPEGFEVRPAGGPGWGGFTVPGQWLQQGYDIPMYQTAGVGRDFEIPASWAGKRIFLRFDAVHAGSDYWLNGRYLGYSENLFTPVEWDITSAARPGRQNHLAMAMRVTTPSEVTSFASGYTFHSLGGIDRSVRLFALPPVYVGALHYETSMDADYRDAALSVTLDVVNAAKAAARGLSLRLMLESPDGKPIPLDRSEISLNAPRKRTVRISRRFAVPNPLKWSSEKPHLHTLTVQLRQDGSLLEQFEQSVGFRTIELRGTQLYVNGAIVKLAGIGRHEFNPLAGRADTAKYGPIDAQLMKEANFNYVRTTHYPPTREFLDTCDRLGLYVECEAPYCWTRNHRGEDDPKTQKHFLRHAGLMLEYNRNHPSVIFWSVANESGGTPDQANKVPRNFVAMIRYCRKLDPSRPVVFNNEWNRDGKLCPIAIAHYPSFPVEESRFLKGERRPIMLDEYFPPHTDAYPEELGINPGLEVINWSTGHNSPDSYWNQVYRSKRVIGASVWGWSDEEFYFPDGTVKGYGQWGLVDVWRRPKSLWWDARRMFSPFWIPVRQVAFTPGQTKVRIPVENRYSFTDLGELRIWWEVGPHRGRCDISLPPHSSGWLEIPIPGGVPSGAVLVIRARDARGGLLTAHGVTLGKAKARRLVEPSAGCPNYTDDGQVIHIRGRGFEFGITRFTSHIRWPKAPASLLMFPAVFVTRRESKCAYNRDGLPYAQYPDQPGRYIESMSVRKRGSALAVTMLDHYEQFRGTVEMLLDTQGNAVFSFDYLYKGKPFSASELGLRFITDRACREIRWRRRSEWDIYPQDHIGRPEGAARAWPSGKPNPRRQPPPLSPPAGPWYLDENQYGSRDFRAAKYSIETAQLLAPSGAGIQIDSNGTTNVRACVMPDGVHLHVLRDIRGPGIRDTMAEWQYVIEAGSRLSGSFHAKLLVPGKELISSHAMAMGSSETRHRSGLMLGTERSARLASEVSESLPELSMP